MNIKNNNILVNFKRNVASVHELVNFDETVQVFYLNGLNKAEKAIENFVDKDHPTYGLKKEITMLRKIRDNESLRPYYETMFNQCVVLLVSYFTSAVKELFDSNLTHKIKNHKYEKPEKEEIKISLDELDQLNFDLSNDIGRLIIDKNQISFQDMLSIARAFKEHFNFEPEKDENVNNIIVSQACRHSIVHSGGIVNQKTIRQISKATPRVIKKELKNGEKIQFDTNEIKCISDSMTNYIEMLISELNKQ